MTAQSAHKAATLYQARSLSLLMRRDALLALAEEAGGQAGDLLLVNPLPWPRKIAGWVAPGVGHPRGVPSDNLAGAHFQDRKADLDPLDLQDVPEMPWKQYPEHALPATDVPAHCWPVHEHRVVRNLRGLLIIQWLQMGARGHGLRQEIFLPDHAAWIEFRSRWMMEPEPEPQAHYFMFPFALDAATPRVDLGGDVMRPGQAQLPGCCHDYFTAQSCVDFSNEEAVVTVALPENPMVQFGDFCFGLACSAFPPGPATLLGWVTANYWHCNFPACQPGWVRSRYRMQFHGAFDEATAHRFGAESAEERPLLHGL